MRLYDVEASAKNIVDTGEDVSPAPRKFDNGSKFKGLKV
jgi:hypothetical protein